MPRMFLCELMLLDGSLSSFEKYRSVCTALFTQILSRVREGNRACRTKVIRCLQLLVFLGHTPKHFPPITPYMHEFCYILLPASCLSPHYSDGSGLPLDHLTIERSVTFFTPTSEILGPEWLSAAALFAASVRLCSEPMLGNTR